MIDTPDVVTRVRAYQRGRCATCWSRPVVRVVRLIADTEDNLRKYGAPVIDHDANFRGVCSADSCGRYWDLSAKPYSQELLAEKIRLEVEASDAHGN